MSQGVPSRARNPLTWGSSKPALTLAAIASVLASGCCVLPLLFAIVGVSGAWISQLRWLEPYSVGLTVLAFAALGLAAWHLFPAGARAAQSCATGDSACNTVNTQARRWFWLVCVLTLIPILVPLAAPMFY